MMIPPAKMRWLAFAATALLHVACSAQTHTSSPKSASNENQPAETTNDAATGSALQPGEYITEEGWGRLLLKRESGALTFSLESVIGEDTCGLDGTIQGDQGITKDSSRSACSVRFTKAPRGIDVSSVTPEECKAFCGYNGDFEAPYLRVKDGCGRDDIARTRTAFQRLYDGKDYKAALNTLSPVVANCLPTLDWEEEGVIRNDLAIAKYKNGLHAQCLATLDKYAEDADKEQDAVVDGWTPALADRHLAIVRAARTNIGLCRAGLTRE